MTTRSRLASLALPTAIVLVALVPQAALTGDAEACSKGGSPAARHRAGAVIETPNQVPTDLVIVRSPVASLGSSTPLTPTEATIERADGTTVPLRASQLGEMPHPSLAEVRSALIPETPLEPNTAYAVVIKNLATRADRYTSKVTLDTEARRLPFTTGAGPRLPAPPVVLQEVTKSVQIVGSATQACCKRSACGTTYDSCVPRDQLTREIREIRIAGTPSPDVIITARVTSDRAVDPAQDEQGWKTTPGTRTPQNNSYGSIEAVWLPLLPNEHACVVAVATDLFTGLETLSAPVCVEGPSTLAAPVLACDSLLAQAKSDCSSTPPELAALVAVCKGSPTPPAPPPAPAPPTSGAGSDPALDPTSSSSSGCSTASASAAGLPWLASLAIAALVARAARTRRPNGRAFAAGRSGI